MFQNLNQESSPPSMQSCSSLCQWCLDIPTFLEIYKCIRQHFVEAMSLSASSPVRGSREPLGFPSGTL